MAGNRVKVSAARSRAQPHWEGRKQFGPKCGPLHWRPPLPSARTPRNPKPMGLLGCAIERTKGYMKQGTSALELDRQEKTSARRPGVPDCRGVQRHPKELSQGSVLHGIEGRGVSRLQLGEPRSAARFGF